MATISRKFHICLTAWGEGPNPSGQPDAFSQFFNPSVIKGRTHHCKKKYGNGCGNGCGNCGTPSPPHGKIPTKPVFSLEQTRSGKSTKSLVARCSCFGCSAFQLFSHRTFFLVRHVMSPCHSDQVSKRSGERLLYPAMCHFAAAALTQSLSCSHSQLVRCCSVSLSQLCHINPVSLRSTSSSAAESVQ